MWMIITAFQAAPSRRTAARLVAGTLLLALVAACGSNRVERCRPDSLTGTWRTTWAPEESWTFAPDGTLTCSGPCNYGSGIGVPRAWAYDPSANAFGGPISHLKLSFSGYVFEGVTEAYRCEIDRQGQRLLLTQLGQDPLRLVRE